MSRDVDMASRAPTRPKLTTPAFDAALDHAIECGEIGIQVAVYVKGERVIDTWAGINGRGGPVDSNTVFTVFSISKAMSATALHLQAERGLVDYDAPLAEYWPEYAKHGKGDITVKHILSHQGGVPQMPRGVTPETMADWEWMIEGLADVVPYAPPGTSSAYQSLNFGWLVGEVVRRTDPKKREFAQFVREELCDPLGAPDFWFGLPQSEFHRHARLYSDMYDGPMPNETNDHISRVAKPWPVAPIASVHNKPVVMGASLPGAGGIGSAASVARIFAMLANGGELDGVRLLSPERIRYTAQPRPNNDQLDTVLLGGGMFAPNIGPGGYWLDDITFPGEPGSFICHQGQGHQVAFAYLDKNVAGVVLHNRLHHMPDLGFDPLEKIGDAVRALA